jgi:hypothetical protein
LFIVLIYVFLFIIVINAECSLQLGFQLHLGVVTEAQAYWILGMHMFATNSKKR